MINRQLQQAQRYLKQEKWDKAEQAYRAILARFPRNPAALRGLETIHQRAAVPEQALQSLTDAYQREQYQQVLARSTALLQQYPRSFMLHNMCGQAQVELGQTEAAINNFIRAVEYNPEFVDGYNHLAQIFQRSRQYKAALECFNRLIKANRPKAIEPEVCVGFFNHQLGNHQQAIDCYKHILQTRSSPTHKAEAHYHLAMTLMAMGRHDEALENFSRAIKSDSNARYYNSLGHLQEKLERYNDAMASYHQAMDMENDFNHVNYGDAFNRLLLLQTRLAQCVEGRIKLYA